MLKEFKSNIVLFIIGVLTPFCFYTQIETSKIDSLESLLKEEGHNVTPVLLNDLADAYQYKDIDQSIRYANSALELALKNDNQAEEIKSYYILGSALVDKGDFESALQNYQWCEKKAIQANDSLYLAKEYFGIGLVNYYLVYFEKTKEYWEKELEVEVLIDDIMGQALSLSYLSSASLALKDTNASLEYDLKSLELFELVNDVDGIASSLYNISSTYIAQKRYEEALPFLERSLVLNKSINDIESTALTYLSIGDLYASLGKEGKSTRYYDSTFSLTQEFNRLNEAVSIYRSLFDGYLKINKEESALLAISNYIQFSDSLHKLENSQLIAEMQTKYDTEKKEKENELLKKENELSELENLTRKKQTRYLIVGLSIAFILLIVILNRFMLTRKQKQKIEKQKEIIEEEKKAVEVQKQKTEEQKLIIEEKNHEIMASINYAKKIQTAILKEEQHVSPTFPEHFILFLPKDVVSGDFYWAIEKGNYIYITAADCTGHGVPGAFMSMLGISFLNEINNTEKIQAPAQILNDLRTRIIKELGQTGEIQGSKDGMDMSLVRINTKTNEIAWAGANNPLYVIDNEELIEIKGDRQPVGYSDQQKPFTDHRLELKKGMVLYLFSDGFHDQFGGSKGKKYKTKQLKNKFLEIHKEPLLEQKNILHKEFLTWRGDIEQIDDVCVIGLKL